MSQSHDELLTVASNSEKVQLLVPVDKLFCHAVKACVCSASSSTAQYWLQSLCPYSRYYGHTSLTTCLQYI